MWRLSGANGGRLQLDMRICEKCPLGPEPGKHRFCKRCEADAQGIADRKRLIAEESFVHRGVNFAPALEYDLLKIVLMPGDPAA